MTVTRVGPTGRRGRWEVVASGDRVVYSVAGGRLDVSDAPAGSVRGIVGTTLGDESWVVENGESPLLAVGDSVICSLGDGVAAFDARDGGLCWRYTDGEYPTLAGGLVCTTSGHTLFGLDPRDGRRRWKTENFADGSQFEYTVSKLAGDERLLCGVRTVEYDTDSLVAFDPTNGTVRWRGNTGPCRQPPVVRDERVYTLSTEGTLASFTRRGERLWTRDATGESLPAVDDGRLWSATPGRTVLVRDAATGREQWRTTVGDARPSRPLLTPSCAYVLASESGTETRLLAVDRASRSVRRSQRCRSRPNGCPRTPCRRSSRRRTQSSSVSRRLRQTTSEGECTRCGEVVARRARLLAVRSPLSLHGCPFSGGAVLPQSRSFAELPVPPSRV